MISAVLTPFGVGFALSLVLVRVCRAVAIRMGRVAHPRADRWHRRPVALLGGVGMALSLFLTTAWFGLGVRLPILLACAAAMTVIGLIDDLISMKPASKLIAQMAIASVLLFFDYRLYWLNSITLDMLLTLVWMVGITNAFNLLDNMDGLCGGVSIVAGVALLAGLLPAAGAASAVNGAEITYLAALLGAIAGFLVYNIHPASIFMGDSGALLLGFSFAALTLTTGREIGARSNLLSIVAVPVLVLLIPIFDTTLVTVSRLLSGRPASQGGRDHSSHRLVAMGLSEPRAVALLWALAAIGAGSGVALTRFNQSWSFLAALGFVLAMAIFAVYLGGIRVYTSADQPATGQPVTPLIVDFVYKRRVAEVLLDFMLVTLCYYAAYRMRFEDPYDFQANFPNFTRSLPVVLAAQMVAFFFVGVYRGVWRQFGLMDAVVIVRGVFLGVVTSQLVILYLYRFFSYSRAVFAVNGVLLVGAMVLSRASFRLVGEFMQRLRETGTRVVVYGAGAGGALAVRELQSRPDVQYRILGFADDDRRKIGTRVHGYPVLGDFTALRTRLAGKGVDLVVVSARSLHADRLRDLRAACAANAVALVRLQVGLEDLVIPIDPPHQASGFSRKI